MAAKARAAILGTTLLILLAAPLAGGFFPEKEEVADRIAKNYQELDSWKVSLELNGTSKHRIISWRKKDLWRQEWIGPQGNSTRVLRAAVGKGKQVLATHPESSSIPLPPLNLGWIAAPLEKWDSLGIDAETKSYQFLGDRPCLVLGAEYADLEASQVWIDIERHVPLRLITEEGIGWRWMDYYNLGNHPLPSRMRLSFQNGRSQTFDLEWSQVATELSGSRFEESSLRREMDQKEAPREIGPRLGHLLFSLPQAR